jgi:hypothetical protein
LVAEERYDAQEESYITFRELVEISAEIKDLIGELKKEHSLLLDHVRSMEKTMNEVFQEFPQN